MAGFLEGVLPGEVEVTADAGEGKGGATAMVPKFSVFAFRSFEELSPWQEEWDAFIESSGCEIFLTYDWLATWWKYYGKKRKLLILYIKRRGLPVAALPFFRDEISFITHRLRIVKLVGSEYLPATLSLPVNSAYVAEIARVMRDEIAKEWRYDVIFLGTLAGKCAVATEFYEALKGAFGDEERVNLTAVGVQTYFFIPDSWSVYLSKLSKKKRYYLRQCEEELRRDGINIDAYFANGDDWPVVFDAFVKQHQAHWRAKGMAGHFGDWPHALAFHREVAARQKAKGRLRLMVLSANDDVIGFEYMYKIGEMFQHYLGARHDAQERKFATFGRVSFLEKFKLATKEQVKIIDSMRGHYNYKVQMGGVEMPTRSIEVDKRTRIKAFKIAYSRLLITAVDLVFAKLWRRIARRLGIIPGVPPDFWLRTHMLAHRWGRAHPLETAEGEGAAATPANS